MTWETVAQLPSCCDCWRVAVVLNQAPACFLTNPFGAILSDNVDTRTQEKGTLGVSGTGRMALSAKTTYCLIWHFPSGESIGAS